MEQERNALEAIWCKMILLRERESQVFPTVASSTSYFGIGELLEQPELSPVVRNSHNLWTLGVVTITNCNNKLQQLNQDH